MKFKTRYESNRSSMQTLAGLALAAGAALVFSMNLQAQDCTIENWSDSFGFDNGNPAGTQGAANRRFAGPCGLRVPIDGEQRYLVDESPVDEQSYNVRFYVFLDDADVGADDLLIFAANDGTGDLIRVWYDGSDLELSIFDSADEEHAKSFAAEPGWNEVDFAWSADVEAEVRFSVNGADDQVMTVDTSGLTVAQVFLGNLNPVNTGGSIDFDDFDSRRQSRPERLVAGDANGDGGIGIFDIVAVRNEILERSFAPGQPDCNRDGSVSVFDIICMRRVILELD